MNPDLWMWVHHLIVLPRNVSALMYKTAVVCYRACVMYWCQIHSLLFPFWDFSRIRFSDFLCLNEQNWGNHCLRHYCLWILRGMHIGININIFFADIWKTITHFVGLHFLLNAFDDRLVYADITMFHTLVNQCCAIVLVVFLFLWSIFRHSSSN